MHWATLITISRPRFWMYLFGPFLIWWVAGLANFQWDIFQWLAQYKTFLLAALLLVAADYFLFSANLFVYGINDLSDDDTDKYNTKKWSYEHSLQVDERTWLARQIIIFAGTEWLVLMLLLVRSQKEIFGYEQRRWWIIALLWFWLSAYFYSSVPIRAKSKPFIDGIFNVLYIFPALIGWLVSGQSGEWFSWLAFAWGLLWAMAMHAYSAIPDIEPDKQAWLLTTAVFLGKTKTLIYCALLRWAAAILGYTLLWAPLLLIGCVYLLMIGASFTWDIMKLYTFFPWINWVVGFLLFWLIVIG